MRFFYGDFKRLDVKERRKQEDVEDIQLIEFPDFEDDVFEEHIEDSKIMDTVEDLAVKNIKKGGMAFLSGRNGDEMGCLILDNGKPRELIEELLNKLKIKYSDLVIVETTIERFFRLIDVAEGHKYISNKYKLFDMIGLGELYGTTRYMRSFSDRIDLGNYTKKDIFDDVKKYHLSKDFKDEIDRISKSKQKSFVGIPAHYIISSESSENRKTMIVDLLSMLERHNRLLSRRYTIVPLDEGDDVANYVDRIYKINEGETVVLKINRRCIDNGEFSNGMCNINLICDIVKKYCSKTLTIFSVDSGFEKVRNSIQNNLAGLTTISFTDDVYTNKNALELIKEFASKDGVEPPLELVERIKNSDRVFNFIAVSQLYSKWYHDYLSKEVFPEYKEYTTIEQPEKLEQTDSLIELSNLIGLDKVKKVVGDIINYFKLQNEYRRRNISFYRPCMHMVFTGNPGTAKTTVARLIAKILKENDILSTGNLVEAGRADIVAEYVGQTAPLIKRTFEKARGSVLFIDEAYSLVDDKKGMYGDEAINTIVQEMENNRDNTIVIFAGYKKEMDEFLNRNPGLTSRIAFHINFDDYSVDELLNIARHITKETGYYLSNDAENKIKSICEDGSKCNSFGNGRFVRTLIEQAKLKQANRLFKNQIAFMTNEELLTLVADDFEYQKKEYINDDVFRVGFGA